MRKTKKLVCLLTLTVMFFLLVVITACNKDKTIGGKDGNITWHLSDDGILTISGHGDMKNYKEDDFDDRGYIHAPWAKYSNSFTALVIEEGVTHIGSYAFYYCSGFTGNLTLPAGLKSIGNSAFQNCYGFTGNLTLPTGLRYISNEAFFNCRGFTGSLILPEGIKKIGYGAFWNCAGFTGSLILPASLTYIDSHAFECCRGFTGLTILEGIKNIGFAAFSSCSGLTDVINYSMEPQSTKFGFQFDTEQINNITLHVQEIALEKYSFHEFWGRFGSIVAIEN